MPKNMKYYLICIRFVY